MIRFTHYRKGQIAGVLYDFEGAGDALPEHDHNNGTPCHNVVVLRGAVHVSGPGLDKHLTVGDILELTPTQRHTVVAETAGARTLHLLYDGGEVLTDGFQSTS